MTESEWGTSTDPGELLAEGVGASPPERLRGLVAASLGRVSRLLDRESQELAAVYDRWVRGEGPEPDLTGGPPAFDPESDEETPESTASLSARWAVGGDTLACLSLLGAEEDAAARDFWVSEEKGSSTEADVRRAVRTSQAAQVRCLLGPPFAPFVLDPDWRTSAVLDLARWIGAEQRFDRLPVLADALQDAGCEHAAALAHLRGPGPHFPGCFVLAALAGHG